MARGKRRTVLTLTKPAPRGRNKTNGLISIAQSCDTAKTGGIANQVLLPEMKLWDDGFR